MKQMPAAKFKAQCLSVLDQVEQTGEPVIVTKRGKPVAKVVPARRNEAEIFGYLAGKATITGDVLHSQPTEDWRTE